MIRIIGHLAEHGGLLLLGVTVLLGTAVVIVRWIRAPVYRQRVAELALVTTACWLALALIPLPRLQFAGLTSVTHLDPVAAGPAEETAAEPEVWGADRAAGAPSPPSEWPSVIEPTSSPRREGGSRVVHPSVPAGLPLASSVAEVPWRTLLAALYLAGSGICLAWLGIGHVLLIRTVRSAADPEPWLLGIYRSLPPAAELRRVRLLVSPRCRRPMVFGVWRARVVLPESLCAPEKAGQLRAVLLHELAHAWRGDAWGHGLFNLACPLLYGHPFYWWLRGQAHFARELIADDWAARFGPKHSYVEELVDLARGPQAMMPGVMGVLGVFRLRTQFYRRMTMLIDRKHSLATSASRRWMLTSLVGCAALLMAMAGSLGVSSVDADQPASGSAEEQADPEAAPTTAPDSRRLSIGGGKKPVKAEAGDAAAKRRRRAPDILTIEGCLLTLISDVEVPAQTGGVLVEVAAKEGASVERGQLLARIDDSQARLRLESTKARLDQVKLLEIRLEAAELEADHAKRDRARVTELVVREAVSESDLKSAEFAAERASFRVKEAEQELEAASRVGKADARVAMADLDRTRITAPIDGIVVERYVDEGEWVKQGDPICRVIKMDRLRAKGFVQVEQCDPGDLKPGQAVEIVVESPRAGREDVTLPGKTTYVSPLLDSGSRYQVWVEFDNVEGKSGWVIRPGLRATMIVKEVRTTRTRAEVSTRGLTPDAEGWILLAPLVQGDRDTREASWKWDGQTATFSASRPRAHVSFPVTVTGSYELEARVTITRAKETTLISLPIVGTRAVLVDMKGDRGNSASPTATIRLKGVRPEPQPKADPSMNVGTEYALTCRVAVSPEAVGVEIVRDDQLLYQWDGPLSQVAERRMMRPETVELETAYYTSSKFTDLRLRMLAGEATALFPGPAAPPGRGETN